MPVSAANAENEDNHASAGHQDSGHVDASPDSTASAAGAVGWLEHWVGLEPKSGLVMECACGSTSRSGPDNSNSQAPLDPLMSLEESLGVLDCHPSTRNPRRGVLNSSEPRFVSASLEADHAKAKRLFGCTNGAPKSGRDFVQTSFGEDSGASDKTVGDVARPVWA